MDQKQFRMERIQFEIDRLKAVIAKHPSKTDILKPSLRRSELKMERLLRRMRKRQVNRDTY